MQNHIDHGEVKPPSYSECTPPAYLAKKTYSVLYVPSVGPAAPGFFKITRDDSLVYRADILQHGLMATGANIVLRAPGTPMPASIENIDPRMNMDNFRIVAECELTAKNMMMFSHGSSASTTVERTQIRAKKLLIKSASAHEAFTFAAGGSKWTWRPKNRAFAGWNTPDRRSLTKGIDKNALELFAADSPALDSVPSKSEIDVEAPSAEADLTYIHWSPLPGAPLPPQPATWRIGRPVAELAVLRELGEEVELGALLIALALDERQTGNHSKEAW